MELKEILTQYKKATEDFIDSINKDEDSQVFMDEREKYINMIKELSPKTDEFRKIVNEINLLEVEKRAEYTLNKEKEKLRNEIAKLRDSKKANMTYGNTVDGVRFLDQEI